MNERLTAALEYLEVRPNMEHRVKSVPLARALGEVVVTLLAEKKRSDDADHALARALCALDNFMATVETMRDE